MNFLHAYIDVIKHIEYTNYKELDKPGQYSHINKKIV